MLLYLHQYYEVAIANSNVWVMGFFSTLNSLYSLAFICVPLILIRSKLYYIQALSVKKVPSQKLSTFPDKISSELDNDHLNAINRLCEFWHKSRNALLIDDQVSCLCAADFWSSHYSSLLSARLTIVKKIKLNALFD